MSAMLDAGAMAGIAAAVLHSRWTLAVGAALVHFVWQAGLVAVGLAALHPVLRRARATTRYGVSLAALIALPVIFAATVAWAAMNASGAASAMGAWLAGQISAWLPALALAWAAGVMVAAAQAAGGWIWVQRIRRGVDWKLPAEWRRTLARLARGMGLARAPRMGVTAAVESPCVVGWWRPLILMPVSAVTAMPVEHLEALLAHELAHIRRHDYLVNLLQRGVEVAFFFHPAVWWLGRQVEQEREHCCDDAAIAACGNRLGYARALVELAGRRAPQVACAAQGGSLRRRVARIVGVSIDGDRARGGRREWLAASAGRAGVALALAAALGVGLFATRGVSRAPEVRAATAVAKPGPGMVQVAPMVVNVTARAAKVALMKAPMGRAPAAAVAKAAAPPASPAVLRRAVGNGRQVVTVTFAAFESCGPDWVVVQHVAPTGAAWLSLEPVVRCVPVIQPTGVLVTTL